MGDSFDPYHVWLGIPKAEQPCDFYRLLGLTQLEDDPRVIEVAADKQMAHVRTFQARHADKATALLNELSRARNCLLNAKTKLAYDQQLRPTTIAPLEAPGPQIKTGVKKKKTKTSQGKQASRHVIQVVFGGVVGVLLAIIIVWWSLARDPFGVIAWLHNNTEAPTAATSSPIDQNGATKPKADSKPRSTITGAATASAGSTLVKSSNKDADTSNSTLGPSDSAELTHGNRASATARTIDPSVSVSSDGLRQGLRVLEFARQDSQRGNDGYVAPSSLGVANDNEVVVNSIKKWSYSPANNAVAIGYLRIEQPGEYVFNTYNYYDRGALFVGAKLVCPYRGSVRGGSASGGLEKTRERIVLAKGLVPFAAIGYADARGTLEVHWCPPGENAWIAIPEGVLCHPTVSPKSGAEISAFLGAEPRLAATANKPEQEVERAAGATISVRRMKPFPAKDTPLPELVGGTGFTWASKPKTQLENGVAEFEIIDSGIVYLVASWPETDYQGSKGSWYKERQTKESLVQQGWEHLGKWPTNPKRSVFRKLCAKGESYSIRTNKYWPPSVICPPR